ncbi:MAG: 2-oxoglutarate dehydrogenase complex dihydrolipoyllysine-residue succinyltransferase [Pirellulaceae bacterium]|jgi:2-oxoglutarate dehydrogenase E2 component (dihydrolipoamide succinyltransferase)|nr:2-oxoglutarate dehydrogenase complex dihydrolipoyllysine-residue succinyltransferase [Pirellulaceae bacterium]
MVQEVKVPPAGESIQEVQIGQWLKREGEWVERDEPVVELETDKASMDVPAPVAGVLEKILKRGGEAADIGEVIGLINDAADKQQAAAADAAPGPLPEPLIIMPAAQRLLAEHGLQGRDVAATGPGGRLLREDVVRHLERATPTAPGPAPPPTERGTPAAADSPAGTRDAGELTARPTGPRQEETVPMTLIRRRIAERLVQAQHQAALLTTFNEIDMSAVMNLRTKYRDAFQERYEVKLGFMSFFTKACIEALKAFPALNAEIRGQDIVYRNYYDIGIAIGSGKGLVVPVLRNAERMSFADIERQIADLAQRAQANKIRPEELDGGTFTITNGGVYGSLLSTPIINPPQSGVLGLHAIVQRPIADHGEVVIRPMMYVALTYDHRIVDGREAVTFLRRIKEIIEDPARLLMEV